ncbi:MAG: efflux RND transporter periplasmic adaptor subunit [Myxococcales bacterium]|nr:efflux RND transporter periplasmic adaptor subunit [Myxococcales bacterium]
MNTEGGTHMSSIVKRRALWVLALLSPLAVLLAWQLLASEPTPLPGQNIAHAQKSKDKKLYTCGMHPNVVQEGPGKCPICGMNLTPMKSSTSGGGGGGKKGKRKILYWRAPMDPTYVRKKPGKSPMGMDLVPVYADQVDKKTVSIDPVVVQNMGVRVAKVKRRDLTQQVRTIGEVVVAEDKLSVVNLKFSGWIERLYVDQTGVRVRAGQALFRIYSPELVAAQEEYLLAVRSSSKDTPLARSARTKLKLWDLSDRMIDAIAKRGKALRTLTIRAPRSGYVLHKNVVQGARAMAGQDLFRIGKLSAIWVHVQAYEFQAPWIKVAQPATMELSFQRGKLYQGKVSYIYPTLNERTRTLTVRLEFVNPQLRLKPGMFTTVRIKTRPKKNVLAIPTEAIIHSGERQLVFVARDVGKYEARQIVTGLTADDNLTEVTSGLMEGETVVVSGQFLLDSESQLREAVQKLLAARLHKKSKSKPGAAAGSGSGSAAHAGHQHGSASQGAPKKGKLDYTCSMHPQISEPKPGDCPICGMKLVKRSPAGSKKPPKGKSKPKGR